MKLAFSNNSYTFLEASSKRRRASSEDTFQSKRHHFGTDDHVLLFNPSLAPKAAKDQVQAPSLASSPVQREANMPYKRSHEQSEDENLRLKRKRTSIERKRTSRDFGNSDNDVDPLLSVPSPAVRSPAQDPFPSSDNHHYLLGLRHHFGPDDRVLFNPSLVPFFYIIILLAIVLVAALLVPKAAKKLASDDKESNDTASAATEVDTGVSLCQRSGVASSTNSGGSTLSSGSTLNEASGAIGINTGNAAGGESGSYTSQASLCKTYSKMRVQTEEWRRFIPGIRMYNGKKTLFYNGENLWEGYGIGAHELIYNKEERESWEVIIVLPGVEIIRDCTFNWCTNLKTVIMADTVQRIETGAFCHCKSLKFVKLSTNLEYIGILVFLGCESLTSIFIPPSCREIGNGSFCNCTKLLILGLPQHVELGEVVFGKTALVEASPFETDEQGDYDEEEVVQWIRSINNEGAYALHHACASYNPLSEIIHDLVKRQGINAMKTKNSIGITPSQYLAANTFSNISEKEIVNRYILDIMGETA